MSGERPDWANVSPGRDKDGNLIALFRDEALAAGWTPPEPVEPSTAEVEHE